MRMDEKTWKEAVDDAHSRPWWVDALIAEAKRARESEARMKLALRVAERELERLADPGMDEDSPALVQVRAALKAMEEGT